MGRGHGQEDVSTGVDKVEDDVRGQVGAETCAQVSIFTSSANKTPSRTLDLGGEEDEVIIVPLAETEQAQSAVLGRLVCNLISSLCASQQKT